MKIRFSTLAASVFAASAAFAYDVGDTVVFENYSREPLVWTGTPVNECNLDFCIPASASLPAGSLVKINKITFASLNTSLNIDGTTLQADPYRIRLNGVNSDPVNGDASADYNEAVANVDFSKTIVSGVNESSSQVDPVLEYEFSNECTVYVGRKYAAVAGNNAGTVGDGIAFLHFNGNLWYSSQQDRCSVRYAQTYDADSVISTEAADTITGDSGYNPIYIVEAEIVSINSGALTPQFEFDATENLTTGSTASGWVKAPCDDRSGLWASSLTTGDYYTPNTNGSAYVYDLASAPYASVPAKTEGFTFSLYGNCAMTSTEGRPVLAMFSDNTSAADTNKVAFFREGSNLVLAFFDGSWNQIGNAASVAAPVDDAAHLFTMVCDPSTGALAIYIDDGTVSATASAGQSVALGSGMQMGNIFGGVSHHGASEAGFKACEGFALLKALGFDSALDAEGIASLAESYPPVAFSRAITGRVEPKYSNSRRYRYFGDCASTGNYPFGISRGTLEIAENATVSVPCITVLNDGYSGVTAGIDVAGTLVVTTESTQGAANVYNDIKGWNGDYKSVQFGHWTGSGTCNITGSFLATNSYISTIYTSDSYTVNVNGGLLKTRGLYAYKAGSSVNLYGNGVLEVAELPEGGSAITSNFRWGTFRTVADARATQAVNFSAATGNRTTLDPCGCTLTFASGTVTGSGAVNVNSSVAGGKVVFEALTQNYTGNIFVTSGEAEVLDDTGYSGSITVNGGSLTYVLTTDLNNIGGSLPIYLVDGSVSLLDPYGEPIDEERITTSVDSATGATVYTISAAVYWTPAVDGKLSTPGNWSTGAVPSNGADFVIKVDSDTEIEADAAICAGTVIVRGSGTATFTGTGDSVFEVTNLVAETAIVAGGTTFQPLAVEFASGASLAIGSAGRLDRLVATFTGSRPSQGVAFTATTYDPSVTDSSKWGGTVWLKSMTGITGFTSNPYGNESSTVRVTGLQGWWATDNTLVYTNTVPVELVNGTEGYAFHVNNGNSRRSSNPNRATMVNVLKGDGTLLCNGSAPEVTFMFPDASGFTGVLKMENKFALFGDTLPEYTSAWTGGGMIYVCDGFSVTIAGGTEEAQQWHAPNNIKVLSGGEIRLPRLEYTTSSTTIRTEAGAVATLYNAVNSLDDVSTSGGYSRIRGYGTLRLESTGNRYRALATSNFPTTMTLENAEAAGILLSVGSKEYTVGNLSGECNIRTDYNDGNRDLRLLQSADTTWSGVFTSWDRLGTLYVDPRDSVTGTVTLAGIQSAAHTNALAVTGSAKITGLWFGDAAVSGVIGGTGTLDGNLVLTDGATVRIYDTATPFAVTGDITATGAIRIELPDGTGQVPACFAVAAGGTVDLSGAEFTVYRNGVEDASVKVGSSGGIRISGPGTVIRIN